VGEDKSSSSKIVLSVTDGKLSILWKINVKANKKKCHYLVGREIICEGYLKLHLYME
jgi:hypothetical protein